jgi:hypothetical protein
VCKETYGYPAGKSGRKKGKIAYPFGPKMCIKDGIKRVVTYNDVRKRKKTGK